MRLRPTTLTLCPNTTHFRSSPRQSRSGLKGGPTASSRARRRSEEHTSELQSHSELVCRLLLEKKKNQELPPPEKSSSSSFDLLTERLIGQISLLLSSDQQSTANFFFNDTATTEIYTLSLHDALPI